MDLPARVGRYEVELLLGEGGIGRVFLARDPVLKRQVALKVLRQDLDLTPERRSELTERVREESRAASTLTHPTMVAIHDMGDDPLLGLYLVFELVHGVTLREKLHDGPLVAEEVAQLASAIGSALTHAHQAGLIHRGVRPENIMLGSTGPKLTDFGLCPGRPRTAAYGAPEAVSSDAWGPGADQFSMAATLYEALTGRRAFPGDDPAAVNRSVASTSYAAPKSVLPALRGFLRLDPIFARALARDPKKRFPSCEAFGSTLAVELRGPRVAFLATPGPVRSSIARATRRWQNAVALGAVVVIFALVVIGRLQQPSAGGTAALKTLASAYSSSRGQDRTKAPGDGRGVSLQRVEQGPGRSAASGASSPSPAPSATSSASGSVVSTPSGGSPDARDSERYKPLGSSAAP